MSKENVTDFKVTSQMTYLSISEDGQIEVPASMERLEKLLMETFVPDEDDSGTFVPTHYLVLLAKEILSLRLENKKLLEIGPTDLERIIRERYAAGAIVAAERIKVEFSSSRIVQIVGKADQDCGGEIRYGYSLAISVRDLIIAFLEQNNESV